MVGWWRVSEVWRAGLVGRLGDDSYKEYVRLHEGWQHYSGTRLAPRSSVPESKGATILCIRHPVHLATRRPLSTVGCTELSI